MLQVVFIIGNKKYAASALWDLQSHSLIVNSKSRGILPVWPLHLFPLQREHETRRGDVARELAGFCVSKSVQLKLCVDGVEDDAACTGLSG